MSARPLARTARLGPNRARQNKAWTRAYGSAERVAWIAALPCVACGRVPCQGHHIVSGGKSRKADARFVVPLCASHHAALHDHGKATFERLYAVNLSERADACERAWRAFIGEAA